MAPGKQRSPTVFILGIMPRSGTNFLSNLLQIHPDCVAPKRIWEDYFLAHADQLTEYSRQVTGHWDREWGIDEHTLDELDTALGNGICEFIGKNEKNRLIVTKTPSVQNLELYFRFFPRAPLLILVRDGRSIVESGIRSFGWRREAALHWLDREARTIVRWVRNHPRAGNGYRLVRYEDLWNEPVKTLKPLLEFLELDPQRYDFEQADQLPVRGSSEIVEQQDQDLHWDPVEKTDAFNPLTRHGGWSGFMHYRYQQVCGEAMEPLGYPPLELIRIPWWWKLRSLMLDGLWLLKAPLRPIYRHLTGQETGKS